MDKTRIKHLFEQYKSRKFSPEEQQEWDSLLNDKASEKMLHDVLDEEWGQGSLKKADSSWSRQTLHFILAFPQKNKKTIRFWPLVSAAAVILILGFGLLFYKFQSQDEIQPGGNKAVLTLQNGKQIELSQHEEGITSDGQGLRYLDGNDITIELDGQEARQMTLQTPKGGQYRIKLADGTIVYLNAASSLHFPSGFDNTDKREVSLEGEAYFDVAKDATKPFYVKTKKQSIRVLGTQFMVTSYDDETYTKTTLLQGSVLVSAGSEKITLKPDQQASLLASGQLLLSEVDASEEMAWIHGEFVFNKESLESITRKLARWYDIEVSFEDNSLREETYEGVISRFDHISKVLSMLSSTNNLVKFELKGSTLKIYRSDH